MTVLQRSASKTWKWSFSVDSKVAAAPFIDAMLDLVDSDASLVVATHDDALADVMDDRLPMHDGRLEDAS